MKSIRVIILSIVVISIILWIVLERNKKSEAYLYGSSLRQNEIVNTVRLHRYGITGERIKIGIIDAGFNTSHPAFEKTKIISKYDFVMEESNVFDRNHPGGVDHGTNVFSVVGGYKVNELIGIAYGAEYFLAKTDISSARLAEEEINAVKASKWLYERGCNVITTSLSFNKFDDADCYYPSQMNGNVATITKTADSLVKEGVVYCSSAGNNYENEWRIIEPPGDGFNVLTAGSIDKNLFHSFFSSCGPTVDGRIKPDIVTPGEGVWNANYLPKMKPEFGWNHGTSLSAPIAAGIAALVLSTHPDLSSFEVIEAIKNTSSKSSAPDSLYGYGIPDAEKAVSYFGPAFSNTPEINFSAGKLEIKIYVFSSFGVDASSVELHILEESQSFSTVIKMTLIDTDFFSAAFDIKPNSKEVKLYFKAKDNRNRTTQYPSGILGNNFVVSIDEGKIQIQ